MSFARREMRPITLIAAAAMLLVCLIALLELQNNQTQNQLVVQQSHLLDQKSVLVGLQTRLFIARQHEIEYLSKPPGADSLETNNTSLQDSVSLLHLNREAGRSQIQRDFQSHRGTVGEHHHSSDQTRSRP